MDQVRLRSAATGDRRSQRAGRPSRTLNRGILEGLCVTSKEGQELVDVVNDEIPVQVAPRRAPAPLFSHRLGRLAGKSSKNRAKGGARTRIVKGPVRKGHGAW